MRKWWRHRVSIIVGVLLKPNFPIFLLPLGKAEVSNMSGFSGWIAKERRRLFFVHLRTKKIGQAVFQLRWVSQSNFDSWNYKTFVTVLTVALLASMLTHKNLAFQYMALQLRRTLSWQVRHQFKKKNSTFLIWWCKNSGELHNSGDVIQQKVNIPPNQIKDVGNLQIICSSSSVNLLSNIKIILFIDLFVFWLIVWLIWLIVWLIWLIVWLIWLIVWLIWLIVWLIWLFLIDFDWYDCSWLIMIVFDWLCDWFDWLIIWLCG